MKNKQGGKTTKRYTKGLSERKDKNMTGREEKETARACAHTHTHLSVCLCIHCMLNCKEGKIRKAGQETLSHGVSLCSTGLNQQQLLLQLRQRQTERIDGKDLHSSYFFFHYWVCVCTGNRQNRDWRQRRLKRRMKINRGSLWRQREQIYFKK